MPSDAPIPVFDGHNDALLQISTSPDPLEAAKFVGGGGRGQIDLPRARAGGLSGGMFAIFVPSGGLRKRTQSGAGGAFSTESLATLDAEAATRQMVSLLSQLERVSGGRLVVCRDVAAIREAMRQDALAAVVHIEGAEAIDPDLVKLDELHAAGLRSLGLVWSRPNIFGHGVPFSFPGAPDIGPGLTDRGKELVRACNRLRILVDLSHLNEKGFWDVAAISSAPLVATHSNVHAICPSPRNLTDRQLDAIAESRGVVGLNFANGFLRPDGRMDSDADIETMLRHLDALIARLGEDGVALGSDFDGARIPKDIGDAAGLPYLISAMEQHDYGAPLIRKIALENWLGLFERIWGSAPLAAATPPRAGSA